MPTLFPVIMAGGSGTRFWPLSRARFASSTTEAIACPDSGAGTTPSVRAKSVATSNTCVW